MLLDISAVLWGILISCKYNQYENSEPITELPNFGDYEDSQFDLKPNFPTKIQLGWTKRHFSQYVSQADGVRIGWAALLESEPYKILLISRGLQEFKEVKKLQSFKKNVENTV